MKMTYDERQEIAEWLDIVKRNCERTLRSIEQLNNVLGGIHCVNSEKSDAPIATKEDFLKKY